MISLVCAPILTQNLGHFFAWLSYVNDMHNPGLFMNIHNPQQFQNFVLD